MKPSIQYAVLDLLLLAGAACGELVEEHNEADEKSVAGTSAAATAGAATSTAEATETAASGRHRRTRGAVRAVRCVRALAPAPQPGGAICNPT
jgi:sRNA-binding protein